MHVRKNERRKRIFINWVMLITGILLFSGCFYFIGKYVYDAVTKIDGASVLKVDAKNEDARLVQDILICIENGDGKSAVDKINSLGPDFSSVRVLEYLRKFRDYYLKRSGINTSIEIVSTMYFIDRSVDLKDFLTASNVFNVKTYLEAVPYFCIKYFAQSDGENQKNGNAFNLDLYDRYIRTFIESEAVPVTTREADILCLYVSAKKEALGMKNDDKEFRQVQTEIEKIQRDYGAQLGENGSCVVQRDALERMRCWCIDKINNKGIFDLFVGIFPKYRIAVEKIKK